MHYKNLKSMKMRYHLIGAQRNGNDLNELNGKLLGQPVYLCMHTWEYVCEKAVSLY